ncbi:MAG TPA: hypothetical protein VGK49_05380 [Ilumatobacteraceae bacterium]
MATRADGKWAASRVGDFGGRQGAGKTDTILARILAGVMLLDEKLIIYTAHEYPTANEIFLRLMALFDNWDDLGRELAKPPKRAHGDQGFELVGKRRILIKTRTGKSGRGFAKADLVVYDEAQHLQPEHVAGSGPAKLAHPNPQSWYAGSGGMASSVKAWEMRRQAILGTGGRLSYTEHTAQIVTVDEAGRIGLEDPDPEDRAAWARANPGLGRWVTEEGMEDMRAELGSLFPREGLCVWEPEPGTDNIIDPALWADLTEAGSEAVSHHSWALSVSPDRKWASIGIAGRRSDGHIHVEWMHHQPGTAWIVDACQAMYRKRKVALRVAANSAEASLIEDISEAGVEVVEVPAGEVARATGEFIDAVNNYGLRHLGQRSLDKAVQHAMLKTTESGASVWAERSSEVEITPLKAVTVALGGVTETGRTPRIHIYDPNWKRKEAP